ncbi:small ribosomal subunit protein uS15m isoform X2 [Scleropages formosus]|uniref:small ribosomal subunit protein uS15m isoform X2 n=1 Tax=Scleropages formosus TaxID=113540 RepID=UPI000878D6D4|nr:28S ribosomal protein S15, mitochondrial isoform X2 [Scleropages formosus]
MLRALRCSSFVLSKCVLQPGLLTLSAKRGLPPLPLLRPLTPESSSCFTRRRCRDSDPRTQDGHGKESLAVQAVRHYARPSRRKNVPPSQLDDLPPMMLKKDYAEVPLINTDDLVKRLLSLEFACHRDKLRLKEDQLVAKVRRDEHDRSSTEVKVALLTAQIRNYHEHLQTHPKDKANKRRMLMAIDRRKKYLKYLRFTRYSTFESVCQKLDITYTLPPAYYRRLTRRWRAKKALCMKVFEVIQRRKAREWGRLKQATLSATGEAEKTELTHEKAQGTTA